MHEWNDFFIATAGAAAALTGLVFVGISISLDKIISNPVLPSRALISLLLLLAILLLSLLFLVPGQSQMVLGGETLGCGLIVWVVVIINDRIILKDKDRQYRKVHIFNMLLDQVAALSYMIGGIVMLCGISGFGWMVPAMIFSFIKSVVDAWVLLVEINR